MNRLGGSGTGGADVPPLQHQQLEEVMGHGDPMLVAMRNNYRQRILEHAERVVTARLHKGLRVPDDWQRGLPELARRVEKVLFEKHPNKREYYNMTNEPIQPHFEFAVTTSLAQTERQRASSTAYARVTQGDTPNELVNTVLSLAINSSDDHSKASNSNLVRTVHWTSPVSCYNNFISSSLLPMATQAIHAPVKEEVSEEPKFSCPFCFEELVDAASTICGHIFCHKCIEFSI
uniref:RING-type domain-containing protein n=1 Tax=Aegilops tauschii subsp. strangulata TaxID=200361 RepID=A0A453GBF6_AEGTS